MKPFGVKVSVINPGNYKTNISTEERFDYGIKESWDKLPPEVQEEYGKPYADVCMYI